MNVFNKIDTLNTGITGLEIKRKNGVVSVAYAGTHTGGPSNLIYNIPVGYRPLVTHRISIYPATLGLNLIVYTNGNITIDCSNGGPTTVQGGISFECDHVIQI